MSPLGSSFRTGVVLRVVGIVALVGGAAGLAVAGMVLAAGAAGVAAVGVAANLARFAERTEREVTRMLEAARYGDAAQAFTAQGRGASAEALAGALTGVMDDVRAARGEAQEQARTLETIVQHVGTGLLAFRRDGHVTLLNGAAKRLLGLGHLREVGHLAEVRPEAAGLAALPPGGRTLVRFTDGEQAEATRHLLASATAYRIGGEAYTLVALHDIGAELDAHEADAWQTLTRVLTHEIMNSVTPIASLSTTVRDLLAESGEEALGAESRADVQHALATIARRSSGLLRFVEAYRSLARLPEPRFALVPLRELFEPLARLLGPGLAERGIALTTHVTPPDLTLSADAALVEQVLINLVQNAADAADSARPGGAKIELRARLGERGQTLVQVTDDGSGIEAEALANVFVPFFTTKPHGSGIGLALARQIMRMHGGTIGATSEPGVRTTFTLRF